jgi:CelD/BcsL family acetyltransferase involved in cellulose biosynthesis
MVETIDGLYAYWLEKGSALEWTCLFVLPPWLDVWWRIFGKEWKPYPMAVREGGNLIGIAPLMIQGERACIIGSPDVCDYVDFIFAPGRAKDVLRRILHHLKQQGISLLDLGPLRGDASLLKDMTAVAETLGYEVTIHPEDVILELELPATWDGFLQSLNGKQRHEIRRKIRRLYEAGQINTLVVEEAEQVKKKVDIFLALFGSSRSDKAAFMDNQMASFFRSLAEAMAEAQILKLFFLDLNASPAAVAMCFDYASTMYLYNNGYDQRFGSLSVGLLSKVFSMKESIERGRKAYSFLKGGETYKYLLGGTPVPVYRCKVMLS